MLSSTTLLPAPASAVPSARSILVGSGPRFAADAFGPLLAFYLVWRVSSLPAAIAASTTVAVAAYWYERRQHRPGLVARLGLAMVALQAVVGLVADSAVAYLAPHAVHAGVMGIAFLGSVVIGKPLAGVFAAEMVDLPTEVRQSPAYRAVFGRVSLAWGLFLVGRAVIRTVALLGSGVNAFVVVNVLTGAPLMSLLLTWSVWYRARAFHQARDFERRLGEPTAALAAVNQ